MYPAVDHGLLSPSGKMSKRARDAALERERIKLFGSEGLQAPSHPQSSERDMDLAQAARLRKFAALHPRKYLKEAERLEKKWL